MLIKERPIITWLLNPDMKLAPKNLVIAPVSHSINQSILGNSLIELDNIRKQAPDWGLPELLMPSFEEVMYKSHQSFDKIMPQLFEDFCEKRNVAYCYAVVMFLLYMDSEIISCIYGILPNKTATVFSISIHAMLVLLIT